MANNVAQGGTVILECVFATSQGFLWDAEDVLVSIYPYAMKPGLPHVTPASAVILEATPERVALGKFSYSYDVPDEAQVGTWYHRWQGTLPEGIFNSVMTFNVLAGDGQPNTQFLDEPVLHPNTLYTLSIDGLLSSTGDTLESVSTWFTGPYDPMYTSYESVMATIGGIVSSTSVDTINYLIWRASQESNSITPRGGTENATYLQFAKKRYTELSVATSLLGNILGAPGGVTSKQLGDLRVTYKDNNNYIENSMRAWFRELKGWERVLNARGNISFGMSSHSGVAVLGSLHPDRPPLGRQIREAVGSETLANTKVVVYPRTRYQAAFAGPDSSTGYQGGVGVLADD